VTPYLLENNLMKKSMKKSLSIALGTTFVAAISAAPVANADTNPFGMQNLESGYMHVAEAEAGDKAKEAKCGEGKAKAKEGKCGGDKAKEAKCGGDKK
jgi:uncharacterized low-complexity protein